MAERKPAKKGTKQSAKTTTKKDKTLRGFTDEEGSAMKERAQELKAATRRGPRADKANGESAVLAKIAEMPEPDRAMAEQLHGIINASAPALSPKTWYGMPAYAKDGKVVCHFQSAQKFKTRYATLGFSGAAEVIGRAIAQASALARLAGPDRLLRRPEAHHSRRRCCGRVVLREIMTNPGLSARRFARGSAHSAAVPIRRVVSCAPGPTAR